MNQVYLKDRLLVTVAVAHQRRKTYSDPVLKGAVCRI